MGNNTGILNENKVIETLNNKKLSDLNLNMQGFVNFLFSNVNDHIITCKKIKGSLKGDISISIGSNSRNVSLKVGKGCSVHQESFYDFRNEFLLAHNAPANVIDGLEKFIVHLGKNEYRDFFARDATLRQEIQNFLDSQTRPILERFLKFGRSNNHSVDVIYYGTCIEGFWKNIDDFITMMSTADHGSFFHIGGISLQAYCRDCGTKKSNEKNDLQSKIDFQKIGWPLIRFNSEVC